MARRSLAPASVKRPRRHPWATPDGNAYWTFSHLRSFFANGAWISVQTYDAALSWVETAMEVPAAAKKQMPPPTYHILSFAVLEGETELVVVRPRDDSEYSFESSKNLME